MKKLSTLLIILTLSLISPVFCLAAPADFSTLYEKVSPAVVEVRVERILKLPDKMPEKPTVPEKGMPAPDQHQVYGNGSGFFIDPTGYILTNCHVINEAAVITVHVQSGKKFEARLIGKDKEADLALLKIEGRNDFPYLIFGDTADVKIGEWVVAFGSPFGISRTMTAGIVSRKNLELGQLNYEDFIQTDAAINPGNSGGPLINMDGEVIGINTLIQMSSGLGYANSADLIRELLPILKKYGTITRGYIGIATKDLEDENTGNGVRVEGVSDGSPAAAAGLKKDDLIVGFGGASVGTVNMLRRRVAVSPIDKSVSISVLRDGQILSLTIVPGKKPDGTTIQTQMEEYRKKLEKDKK